MILVVALTTVPTLPTADKKMPIEMAWETPAIPTLITTEY
jgi:predicted benzoate:H+ symporter BenE